MPRRLKRPRTTEPNRRRETHIGASPRGIAWGEQKSSLFASQQFTTTEMKPVRQFSPSRKKEEIVKSPVKLPAAGGAMLF
jgi:hypothetical protein